MHFSWPIFSNFTNTRYLFFLMCVTCSKEYKTVANGGFKNVSFMMNRPLEIVLCLLIFFATLTWFLSKTLSILRTLIKTNTERKYFYVYKYLILVKLENILTFRIETSLSIFSKNVKFSVLIFCNFLINGNKKCNSKIFKKVIISYRMVIET